MTNRFFQLLLSSFSKLALTGLSAGWCSKWVFNEFRVKNRLPHISQICFLLLLLYVSCTYEKNKHIIERYKMKMRRKWDCYEHNSIATRTKLRKFKISSEILKIWIEKWTRRSPHLTQNLSILLHFSHLGLNSTEDPDQNWFASLNLKK